MGKLIATVSTSMPTKDEIQHEARRKLVSVHEAGHFIARWRLGLQPRQVIIYDGALYPADVWGRTFGDPTEFVSLGEKAILCAAGPAAEKLSFLISDQHLRWFNKFFTDAIRDIEEDSLYEMEEYDQSKMMLVSTAVASLINENNYYYGSLWKLLPLKGMAQQKVRWIFKSYLQIADCIVRSEAEKVLETAEILNLNGHITTEEAKKLGSKWGKPMPLEFSVDQLEDAIGRCPLGKAMKSDLDLVHFVFSCHRDLLAIELERRNEQQGES